MCAHGTGFEVGQVGCRFAPAPIVGRYRDGVRFACGFAGLGNPGGQKGGNGQEERTHGLHLSWVLFPEARKALPIRHTLTLLSVPEKTPVCMAVRFLPFWRTIDAP